MLTDSIARWIIDHIKEIKVELSIAEYSKLSTVKENHMMAP